MTKCALVLIFAAVVSAQTASYPAAVATDGSLKVAGNQVSTTLTAGVAVGDNVLVVRSSTGIVTNMLLTIDSEIVSVCAVNGSQVSVGVASCPNVDGRGFDGTTAATHAAGRTVQANIDRWHHEAVKKELIAVENALGPNLSKVNAAVTGPLPWAAQSPTGSLTGTVAASIAMSPCPVGILVNGTSPFATAVYIAGTGTPEAATVSGGTCTSGAASGTLILTPANSHSAGYTIQSASAGIQEAVNTLPVGGTITLPAGTYTTYATVQHGAWHQFVGGGATENTGKGTYITSAMTSSPVFMYTKVNANENISGGILYAELGITAQYGIQINSTTPDALQGFLYPVFRNIKLTGNYYALGDANRYTATAPTLGGLTPKGVGISCNACFDAHFSNVQIENYGIGIYIQGDQNVINDGSRLSLNGVWVWLDGATYHANMNKISENDLLANMRIGGITEVSAKGTEVLNNYMENGCLSSEFVRSTDSFSLHFAGNHIEDPNGPGCAANHPGGIDYWPADLTTPLLSLDDHYGDVLTRNSIDLGLGRVPPIEFLHTHWSFLQKTNQYLCDASNGPFFPCPTGMSNLAETNGFYPTQPGVLAGAVKPLLFNAANTPTTLLAGTSPSSFAATWKQSSVLKQRDNTTGRWVLATGTDYEPSFQIPDQEYYTYLLNVTARKIGTGVGVSAIQYTDAAGTVTNITPSGVLTFALTTEVETRSQLLSIPSSALGPGKFVVVLDGSNAEIEQVELVPYRAPQLLLGTVVSSGANITAPSQFFHISGTNAISTMAPPVGFFSGMVCAVPDGAFTVTVAGGANSFGKASTAVVGQSICWLYSTSNAAWYPTY